MKLYIVRHGQTGYNIDNKVLSESVFKNLQQFFKYYHKFITSDLCMLVHD